MGDERNVVEEAVEKVLGEGGMVESEAADGAGGLPTVGFADARMTVLAARSAEDQSPVVAVVIHTGNGTVGAMMRAEVAVQMAKLLEEAALKASKAILVAGGVGIVLPQPAPRNVRRMK